MILSQNRPESEMQSMKAYKVALQVAFKEADKAQERTISMDQRTIMITIQDSNLNWGILNFLSQLIKKLINKRVL